MINKITFTGIQKPVQEFMTTAAQEFVSASKIFSKAEIEAAEAAAPKTIRQSIKELNNALYFNHRGVNSVGVTQQLTNLEAAKSYAASHGNIVDNI